MERYIPLSLEEASRLNSLLLQEQNHREIARRKYELSNPNAKRHQRIFYSTLKPTYVVDRYTNQYWLAPEIGWEQLDETHFQLYFPVSESLQQYLIKLLKRSEARRMTSLEYYHRMHAKTQKSGTVAATLLDQTFL